MERANERTPQPRKVAAPPSDFTTFSFFDLGGALSAAQRERLVAPIRKLWSRLFKGRGK
jgi:hypothetical protein